VLSALKDYLEQQDIEDDYEDYDEDESDDDWN
jgi:hypothetical protein